MACIEHFAVFADDLEAARTFYERALGLRTIVDNSRAAVRGYFLADERGCALEIIERPREVSAVETRYVCHVAFLVDDVEKSRERIEGMGALFEADTAVDTDSFKTAFFRDPAGNRCQVVWRKEALGA